VIDALAARGVRFADVVTPVPLTLPAHVSLLTATSPLVHGVRENLGFRLPKSIPTAAETFRAAGYETAAFVSAYPLHRQFGLGRGFDHYDDHFTRGGTANRPTPVERRADETVSSVDAWVSESIGHPQRPLFLWVHLFDPHAPYEPPEPFLTRFRRHPYDGEVAFADAQIGVLLERLSVARRGRRQIVAVTADHGEGLGDHGEPTHGLFIYDSTVRVPLILSGVGMPPARVVPSPARLIDVVPTLLDFAGVPTLAGAEGVSLRRAISGDRTTRPAYIESLSGRLCCGWAPLHAWRDGNWIFIDAPRAEFYDLSSDAVEHYNLASSRAADMSRFALTLSAMLVRDIPVQPRSNGVIDRERLRSLGYVSGTSVTRPSLRDPKDMIAVWVRLGAALDIEDREPTQAAHELEAVVRDDPTNSLARRHLAAALGAQRRYGDAVRVLSSLITDGDASVETLDILGKALLGAQRPDEAKRALERALAVAPDDDEALGLLADLAIKRGDLPDARSRLETAYAHDPTNGDVSLKLAIILTREGDTNRAIDVFTRLVEREPANRDALIDLGGALLNAGRPAEAVRYFERATAIGSGDPIAWNGLASAKMNIGDQAGAVEALRHSLRLKPDQADIQAALRSFRR
jgi:arylsulfatase A-like enzyme/predicted Zn-dependent protease